MKRWIEQLPHIKWLRPGMGVKRWVLLLLGGLVLLLLALLALLSALDLSGFGQVVRRLRPTQLSLALAALLLALAGLGVIGLAVYGLNRSLLSAFRQANRSEVAEVVYRHRQRQRGPKIVAVGGGHGLNTLLRGLKEHTDNITAIVTVADDGGSSGRLRRDLGVLPPGDFRNCLAALSDAEGLVSQLFQYRFGTESDLDGHSFGNLYLTAMAAITGSFEAALEESSRVLAVRGRVIPSTLALATLGAEVMVPGEDGGAGRLARVRGESNVGHPGERVQRVFLEPDDAPAYPKAIRAVLDADLIVIGPGSLYTSVLPNLLVPDLARAIISAQAPKAYVCNVATQAGETEGYGVGEHVSALRQHVGREIVTTVLANHTFGRERPPGAGVDWVRLPEAEQLDYRLVTADLVDRQYPWRHDPAKLAEALMDLVDD